MLCAQSTTIYAFANANGNNRTSYPVFISSLPDTSGNCPPGAYVVLNDQEFTEATASPFKLSLSDGGQIATAVILVWAAGWAVRQIVRTIRDTDRGIVEGD